MDHKQFIKEGLKKLPKDVQEKFSLAAEKNVGGHDIARQLDLALSHQQNLRRREERKQRRN